MSKGGITHLELLCSKLDSGRDDVKRLFAFVQNSSVKQLSIVNMRISHNDLEILVPESPKAIELNERLSNEITSKQRKKLCSWQIKKLENNIKNEIELKYNTFDVNELRDTDSQGKYTYKWSTNIEMLYIKGCAGSALRDGRIMTYLQDNLTSQRIKTAYKNLKGLAIDFVESNTIISFICHELLNNLACQLDSLHLYDVHDTLEKWKFVSNNYPCTKDAINSCWFPKSIKHLCLVSFETGIIWHSINSAMFPKLKHLVMLLAIDNQSIKNRDKLKSKNTIKNLASFVNNGLESLWIDFTRIEKCDIFNKNGLLGMISNIFENVNKNSDNKSDGKVREINNNFILKISTSMQYISSADECMYRWDNEQYLWLKKNLFNLYSLLIGRYENVMLAFMLELDHFEQNNRDYLHGILQNICRDVVADCHDKISVDANCRVSKNILGFGVVLKNKNIDETKDAPWSHMEPKHEFECEWCNSVPWFRLA